MTSAKPWIGRKRVAFVPLFRSHAAPPDQIPPEWENAIFRRVVYDPRREANGADRSLRAWLRAASSGLADIDPISIPVFGSGDCIEPQQVIERMTAAI